MALKNKARCDKPSLCARFYALVFRLPRNLKTGRNCCVDRRVIAGEVDAFEPLQLLRCLLLDPGPEQT